MTTIQVILQFAIVALALALFQTRLRERIRLDRKKRRESPGAAFDASALFPSLQKARESFSDPARIAAHDCEKRRRWTQIARRALRRLDYFSAESHEDSRSR